MLWALATFVDSLPFPSYFFLSFFILYDFRRIARTLHARVSRNALWGKSSQYTPTHMRENCMQHVSYLTIRNRRRRRWRRQKGTNCENDRTRNYRWPCSREIDWQCASIGQLSIRRELRQRICIRLGPIL